MPITFRHRVQEWLADRVRFVQYPVVRARPVAAAHGGRAYRPRSSMGTLEAVSLGLLSLFALLVGLALLTGLCIALYAVLS